MRSDQIKFGFERAPHRGLLRATGVVGENDFSKPFVAVCNSYVDVVPGHVHLQAFGKLVKEACAGIELGPEQIAQRLSEAKPPGEAIKSRWLRRYAAMVTSANTGAVLANI